MKQRGIILRLLDVNGNNRNILFEFARLDAENWRQSDCFTEINCVGNDDTILWRQNTLEDLEFIRKYYLRINSKSLWRALHYIYIRLCLLSLLKH